MRFVPTTVDELPVSGRPSSKSAQLLNGFMDAGVDVAEVELEPAVLDADGKQVSGDKTPESVRSSLDNYIQRHDLPITVFTRGGRLFLSVSDTKPSEREKKPRKSRKSAENGAGEAEGTEVATDELPEGVEAVENEYAGI